LSKKDNIKPEDDFTGLEEMSGKRVGNRANNIRANGIGGTFQSGADEHDNRDPEGHNRCGKDNPVNRNRAIFIRKKPGFFKLFQQSTSSITKYTVGKNKTEKWLQVLCPERGTLRKIALLARTSRKLSILPCGPTVGPTGQY